jgi:ribosomal subunit interface protein
MVNPMQVLIQGKHIDIGDAFRGYIEDKLSDTCSKYFNHSVQGDVHLAKDATNHLYRSDITLAVGNGIILKATAEEHEPYPAFDKATHKLANQLKRYKDRLRNHHQRLSTSEVSLAQPANEYTLQAEGENEAVENDNPVIIAELSTHIESLTVSEAVMRLDLGALPALLFKNAGHGGFNMVYRRPDGQIGWVDPQGNSKE